MAEPQSHPKYTNLGCPLDSGGGKLTSSEGTQEMACQVSSSPTVTGAIDEVGNEAKKVESEAFAGSRKTLRSPPTATTAPPRKELAPIFVRGKSLNKLKGRSHSVGRYTKKRKADQSPEENKSNLGYLAQISIKIEELRELVKANATTKVEIKRVSEDLSLLATLMEGDYETDKEDTAEITELNLNPAGPCAWCRDKTASPTKIKGISKEQGTQTLTSKEIKEQGESIHLRSLIDKALTCPEIVKILEKPWPQTVYNTTRLVYKSILTDSLNTARVILINTSNSGDQRLKSLAVHFSSLKSLIGQKTWEKGRIATIEHKESLTVAGEDDEQSRARFIMVAYVSPKPNVEELVQVANNVKHELASRDVRRGSFSPSEDMDVGLLRKIMECCMNHSGIKIDICVGRKKQDKADKVSPNKEIRTQAGKATIVVKAPKSYAETLKLLKSEVKPDELGVLVEGATKTPDGDIRITLRERNPGGKEAFMGQIAKKCGTEATLKTKETPVIIKDLDETVTKDEVQAALTEALNGIGVRVGEVRKGKFGSVTVLAYVPTHSAPALLKSGRIKIGWLHCRMAEKLSLTCCYKCQAFGHTAKQCKAPSNARRCLRCGSQDHLVKTCNETPHCYICTSDGHRADSMACPEYRKGIEIMWKKRNSRKKKATPYTRQRKFTQQNRDFIANDPHNASECE